MENAGFIEIRVNNAAADLSVSDVDITEISELLADMDSFLHPERGSKKNRPVISYNIENGSARHIFHMPLALVLTTTALLNGVSKKKDLSFLTPRQQHFIAKLQAKAINQGLTFDFKSSEADESLLSINNTTNYTETDDKYYEGEFYIYGEIYQEGGKTNPNIHISSPRYGSLTISATKQQIQEGSKKTYRLYGVKAKGRKSIITGKLSNLKLLEFITYTPVFSQEALDNAVRKAEKNLKAITNVDEWVHMVKAESL